MGAERGADAGAAGPPPPAARGAQGRARRSARAAHGRDASCAPTRWCRPRSIPTSRADGSAADAVRIDPGAGRLDRRSGRSGASDSDHQRRVRARLGYRAANAARAVQGDAGAARYTLRSEFAAPAQPGGNWMFALGGGWIVLDPLTPDDEPLVLKRVVMRGNIDPDQQRITLEHGDLGTKELGAPAGRRRHRSRCPASSTTAAEPRLALGIACNPMPAAAFKRLWPSFLSPKVRDWVVGAHRQRKRRAPRHRDQCHVGADAAQRPAAARRGAVDRDRRHRRDAAAGRGTARDPRRRSQRARERPHGEDDARQGHRRCFAGPAADDLQRQCSRCRTSRIKMPPARVSFRVEGAVPAAAELLALERLARILRRAVRSRRHAGNARGAGATWDAAASRSAAGLDRLRHHRRSCELQRRQDAVRTEGRGADAAGHGQQPALRDQGRRQGRGRAGSDRVPQAQGRARRRGAGCRRRSTRRRARGSASISAPRSPARCR